LTNNTPFELLTTNSELAKIIPQFTVRDSQIEMTKLVTAVFDSGRNGIVEAGTGTGKTFAYLLPAMASKKKTIVSTGTKNLQDQLFYQDIPVANKEFRRKVALLKGRANYLCPDRLNKNLQTVDRYATQSVLNDLTRINDWSRQTKTGDLTELLDTGQNSVVTSMVTSTVDNCLGTECDYYTDCPVYRARAYAHEADLIVVNHHLLIADIALKEELVAQLLPEVELVIVDEAHQLPDVARHFFGERVSTGQLLELVRDIQREALLMGSDDGELLDLTRRIEQVVDDLSGVCHDIVLPLDRLMHENKFQVALENTDIAFGSLISHLKHSADRSTGLSNCYSRATRLVDLFALLTEPDVSEQGHAHWLERQLYSNDRLGFTIYLSPVNIAGELRKVISDPVRNWLFVSATLTIAGQFDHIRTSLGIDDGVEAKFDSPFDFHEQVRGYVPADLPLPGSDLHTRKLLEMVLPIVRATTGRTFFLFTSHRALNLTAELLKHEYDITFLKQGTMPKKVLLEKFRELPRCVLLATVSFWEGVDVSGADLRCLVIDKLPFSSPDNPMVQAQLRAIELAGGNGFEEFSIPEAAISLKQGFGRLIRQESDRGLFVLGDTRIIKRHYGKKLLKSLPEMIFLKQHDEVIDYIESLNEPSAVLNKEPPAVPGKEPSAVVNKEPPAVPGREPSAVLHKEPSAVLHKEPSIAQDGIPATTQGKDRT